MSMIDPALQGQVDAQLMEQGAYSALELLFNAGRLSYSDYEAWRRGELELLDGVLMGDPDKIRRQLDAAAGHARNIGLVEQAQEFFTWHTAGGGATRKLRVSADAALERMQAATSQGDLAEAAEVFIACPVSGISTMRIRSTSPSSA